MMLIAEMTSVSIDNNNAAHQVVVGYRTIAHPVSTENCSAGVIGLNYYIVDCINQQFELRVCICISV